jgi:hypothetical protein
MDKAQLERITQLALAAQGKPTKRSVDELLKSERSAAEKYIVRPPPVTTGVEAPQEEAAQTQ